MSWRQIPRNAILHVQLCRGLFCNKKLLEEYEELLKETGLVSSGQGLLVLWWADTVSTLSIGTTMHEVESDKMAECLTIKQITGSYLPPLFHLFPGRHSFLSIFWITLILNYDFASGRMWGFWRVIFLSSMWHLHHMDRCLKCSWEHWKIRKCNSKIKYRTC